MIIHNKPTYKCEHCRKLYQIKRACEKHERSCFKNPDNKRACFDCALCVKVEVDLWFDGHNGYNYFEDTRKVPVLYCSAKDEFLIPPKASHRGNAYMQEDLAGGSRENNSMPMECDKQDKEGYPLDATALEEIQKKLNK